MTGDSQVRLTPTRRQALGLLGAGGLAVGLTAGLSACTGHSSKGSSSSPTHSSPPTSPSTSPSPSAPPPTLAQLSSQLSQPLLLPGSASYPAVAQLYNQRFDGLTKPAAIARCTTVGDVQACVRFAAQSHTPLTVRGGGHSYGGWSSGAGLVVDLRAINAVQVNRAAGTGHIGVGTVHIGGGALLIDVYQALGSAGVAVGGGSCPTVGLTGLALGGGVGVLTRSFGLTCDSVTSIDVVTADGAAMTVDAHHHPDLYWALRGGGASFAVVTGLTMTVRTAPAVQTYFLQFPFGQAGSILTAWQQWVAGRSDALWSTVKLLGRGDGSQRVIIAGTYLGGDDVNAQIAPLLAQTGPAAQNSAGTSAYAAAMFAEAGCDGQSASQCRSDALSAPLRQPFAATSSIAPGALPSSAIAAAVNRAAAATEVPGVFEAGISIDALGGAVARVAPSATAFVHRSAFATVQYTATWAAGAPAGPSAAAVFDTYVRGFRAAMVPWFGTSAYVNYADPTITDYGTAYWGANYPRLQQVKKQYDPAQLFTFAQAVRPA